jgi:hypothetical protein
VIRAVDPRRQAVFLTGDRTAVTGVTLTSTATRRLGALEDHRIVLEGSTGSVVRGVHLEGSSAAGIYTHDAHGFRIEANEVTGTLADGIHATAGSSDGVVQGNAVHDTGDDAIAVVSYVSDGALTSGITITANQVAGTPARGISVVGGADVTIEGNVVEATAAAGIYLASEASFDTYAAQRVRVVGNTVRRANLDGAIAHAGIFAYARGGTARLGFGTVDLQVEDVLIDANAIDDTGSGHPAVLVLNDFVRRVVVRGTTITGTAADPPIQMDTDPSQYALIGNTAGGVTLDDSPDARSLAGTWWAVA